MSTVVMVHVEVFYDYICPWCYPALDRARYLEEVHGVEVVWRPFELHPDWPASGMEAPRYERAGALKELIGESDLPFTGRRTVTNSLAALALSAHMANRAFWPSLHRRLFESYWVEGHSLGDRAALAEVASEFGITRSDLDGAIERGESMVLASKERALDLGISATPGWHFGNGVVFPGVHEPAVFDRIVARLTALPSRGRPGPTSSKSEPEGGCARPRSLPS